MTKTSSDEFLVGDASDIQYDQASEILDSAELPDGHLIRNNIHDGKDGWTLLEISDIPVTDIPDTDSYQKNVDGYLKFTYSFNTMLANTDAVNPKYAALIGQVLTNKTTPLFEKIRVVNCMEGQLDGKGITFLSKHMRFRQRIQDPPRMRMSKMQYRQQQQK